MKKIYSKIDPTLLLHIVYKINELTTTREDIAPDNEFLQVCALNLDKGKTFKPHKHIPCEKIVTKTQESWVIIKGKVKAILYDIDDSVVAEVILDVGDLSITFNGGHNYLILEDNSLIFEFKNGPYFGVDKDKVFI